MITSARATTGGVPARACTGDLGRCGMSDTAILIGAFSGLTVAVGALLVSVGVLSLLTSLGNSMNK